MKTQSCKAKGRKLQQWICKFIVDSFWELEEDDVVSRPMGSGGVDVMLSPLAQRILKLSIESKNCKTKPGPGALKQSRENMYKYTSPIVVWKPPGCNEQESIAMIKFTDLINLIKEFRDE